MPITGILPEISKSTFALLPTNSPSIEGIDAEKVNTFPEKPVNPPETYGISPLNRETSPK
jgi:hypothetical protein